MPIEYPLLPALIEDYYENTECGYIQLIDGRIVVPGHDMRLIFKICHHVFGKYEEFYPNEMNAQKGKD